MRPFEDETSMVSETAVLWVASTFKSTGRFLSYVILPAVVRTIDVVMISLTVLLCIYQ